MSRNQGEVSASNSIITIFVLLTAIILRNALISGETWYWYLIITIPSIVLIAFRFPIHHKKY